MPDAHALWPVQDAKARFSEMLDASASKGPQVVTKRGRETAVVVSIDEWRRIQQSSSPSLKQLLLSEESKTDLPIPSRGHARRRQFPTPSTDR